MQQPDAPTAGLVDDTADTFSFLPDPAYPSFAQYKVNGLPGVTGAVVLDAINSYVQGGRVYVKVLGAVAKGGLAVYVAGSGNVPDGQVLTNADLFTGSVVVTPPATTALTAALAISVASIVAGNPLTFTVTAGGGTAPYSYTVVATNNATGASSILGGSASGSFTPQTAGSYNLDATVTDAAGKVAQATTRTLQVTAVATPTALAVAFTIASASLTAGQSLSFSATASGGTGPYQHMVHAENASTGAATSIGSASTPGYTGIWAALPAGTYDLTDTVTDAAGTSKVSAVRRVVVSPATTPPATGGNYISTDYITSDYIN